ncbi:hypothetical protein [Aquabacterium sp.]|uniref:hypothetical protein n=1 Tax=Aquabacterium sp. TaxID=1872578 RepID=UPI002BB05126|nr:hypothetical protein [Aquabacterium sp.]HSW07983.1 hypothetical protein [Aquabacterium sp.]
MSFTQIFPTATPHAACAERADDELFSLPDWLYRSEAFAEDLPGGAPLAAVAVAQSPRRVRLSSGALYLATLALAVASSVPTALLVA